MQSVWHVADAPRHHLPSILFPICFLHHSVCDSPTPTAPRFLLWWRWEVRAGDVAQRQNGYLLAWVHKTLSLISREGNWECLDTIPRWPLEFKNLVLPNDRSDPCQTANCDSKPQGPSKSTRPSSYGRAVIDFVRIKQQLCKIHRITKASEFIFDLLTQSRPRWLIFRRDWPLL